MSDQACKHKNVQLIARDDDSEYVECLDCGKILEGEEHTKEAGFNEPLSDA